MNQEFVNEVNKDNDHFLFAEQIFGFRLFFCLSTLDLYAIINQKLLSITHEDRDFLILQ